MLSLVEEDPFWSKFCLLFMAMGSTSQRTLSKYDLTLQAREGVGSWDAQSGAWRRQFPHAPACIGTWQEPMFCPESPFGWKHLPSQFSGIPTSSAQTISFIFKPFPPCNTVCESWKPSLPPSVPSPTPYPRSFSPLPPPPFWPLPLPSSNFPSSGNYTWGLRHARQGLCCWENRSAPHSWNRNKN